ncbi:riboflavin biosynthesis protein RibD [Caldalkalibacillus thermarum]|uniref:bifunctional diaminohydroxyphosphoribosylaminopyrimidine deaminase/5-amino-6-(5-phosphoribosylamino)uracil reductase RibD n=1 Tax=Caldalkalibacillus thermarum TaxID=296745 RepID=UPI00166DC3F2|nr:bifunctional diaminohydroxyphosphoribosylaminopyrimidine deaminase/5-amino-6-(5-phosphoribosylamino)uracil reductase RibD [Caldalkalibacillus thermarum]GGK15311.1 riboflavin biosynthesis protein RibD [Caldalkalibacillus thermarum]
MASERDSYYMKLALQLAEATSGQTSPNPVVGAVIVKDSEIVGLGAHLKAGEAHAEVHALAMAKEKAQGATMYVTLEPCSHYGRTPPCADAVIEAGIKRVVIAACDPNPLVRGRGVEKLKAAGLEVEVGLFKEEAERLNEIFNYYIVHRRPFVTLKTATTLDGKIATVTGESQWITGEEARADVHLLRHRHDAILVGINTVLRDNPRLTTRIAGQSGRHPVRVILDSKLRIPLDAQVTHTEQAPTWIFTTDQAPAERVKALTEKGVKVVKISSETRVDVEQVLAYLGEQGIASVLVEGGGEVNASFLQGGFVNKVVAYLAPKLIGGNEAPGAFRGQGVLSLAQSLHLKDVSVETLGQDLKVVGYLK